MGEGAINEDVDDHLFELGAEFGAHLTHVRDRPERLFMTIDHLLDGRKIWPARERLVSLVLPAERFEERVVVFFLEQRILVEVGQVEVAEILENGLEGDLELLGHAVEGEGASGVFTGPPGR